MISWSPFVYAPTQSLAHSSFPGVGSVGRLVGQVVGPLAGWLAGWSTSLFFSSRGTQICRAAPRSVGHSSASVEDTDKNNHSIHSASQRNPWPIDLWKRLAFTYDHRLKPVLLPSGQSVVTISGSHNGTQSHSH